MNIVKSGLAIFLSLIWFILSQGEYEMMVKPYLRDDFPIIKGIGAVYFLGSVLLVIGVTIVLLVYSIIKNRRGKHGTGK